MTEREYSSQSAELLLAHELTAFCHSDSLSEEGLHEIIVHHNHNYLTPNNNESEYIFFLAACRNERVTTGIIQCLLEYFPAAASATGNNGRSPLHVACGNKNVTLNIVQLLIDAAPNSVLNVDYQGWMPLHYLCDNTNLNESAATKILKLLIEKHPEAIRHVDNKGHLPIHLACASRSPEFCRMLIEAYPGPERTSNTNGLLPFHFACANNNVATVECLYKLYPGAINHTTTSGAYPIHYAIAGLGIRSNNPTAAVEIVQFLLDCDPNVKLQEAEDLSLLYFACQGEYTDANIEAALQAIKIIYDAHPEAIEDNDIASNIQRYHQQVQTFINSQLVYSRQAKDHSLMTTPDANGRLPLHNLLRDNVILGSIKLFATSNTAAIQTPDKSGALPLHVACEHHESSSVVSYLLGLDMNTFHSVTMKETLLSTTPAAMHSMILYLYF